jgi:Cysteine-rich domain
LGDRGGNPFSADSNSIDLLPTDETDDRRRLVQIMDKTLKDIVPVGHIYIRENVLVKGNVAGVKADKAAWAKGLGLPRQAEYNFFAGCGYQFMKYLEGMARAAKAIRMAGVGVDKGISLNLGMDRFLSKFGLDFSTPTAKLLAIGREEPYTRILVSAIHVLQKIGLDIGYLYEDEPCCGSPLYYAGFLDDYIENANKNYGVFKKLGVQKVIGLLPACTASLKNLYPKYIDGFDLKTYHFSEILVEQLKKNKIKLKLAEKLVVTYHDPCQLSRYLNLVKEPREILRSIENLELREPPAVRCGQWSTCCGGGGLEGSSPELSERLGQRRVEELLSTDAHIIVSHCPACIMQLRTSAENIRAKVKVLDLVEILDQALP